MKRPLASKRLIGPFFDKGILEARKQCNPELKLEIAETVDPQDVFDLVGDRARFEVDDIRVGIEEGQIGTTEPQITTIQIISDEKEVDLQDLNHMVDVMEGRYTVFDSIVAASVEVDSTNIENPLGGAEFIEESTDVEES
jgi:hypothetical protein